MQGRATIDEELSNGKPPHRTGHGSAREWRRIVFLLLCRALVFGGPVAAAAPAAESVVAPMVVRIDWTTPAGAFRPLHGINKGPLVAGGLIDLRAAHRALALPWVRLHDCHWPNPDVVDMHVVFPSDSANPSRRESYDFRRTDDYLRAIQETGARMIYRLGESIEHTNDRRFTHPPRDPAKWADACLGIIRHYNEGWADGLRFGIRYWEIWNEPENRPAMWSGTDDDYLRLYKTAALRIKQTCPTLAVGGPGAGSVGKFEDGTLAPSNFMARFVEMCRTENVPLDFFSWHFYGDDPERIVMQAHAIRRWLDASGFTKTESHLNEWNFLPNNDWRPLGHDAAPTARRAHYEKIAGAEGAAFIVAVLLALQEAPVDVCNLFHGEIGGFGLFDEFGVPTKSYEAIAAFAQLLQTPRRLQIQVEPVVPANVRVAVGADATGGTIQLLAANRGDDTCRFTIATHGFPWSGKVRMETRRITRTDSFTTVEQRAWETKEAFPTIVLPPTSVTLISLRKP
ncbi:MAG TPA: hypothetical protein VFV83_02255 [Chthoniobacteraceae bacterium]|nr:hypothetical protein [Chthoniobacteraceae bacterium]